MGDYPGLFSDPELVTSHWLQSLLFNTNKVDLVIVETREKDTGADPGCRETRGGATEGTDGQTAAERTGEITATKTTYHETTSGEKLQQKQLIMKQHQVRNYNNKNNSLWNNIRWEITTTKVTHCETTLGEKLQ